MWGYSKFHRQAKLFTERRGQHSFFQTGQISRLLKCNMKFFCYSFIFMLVSVPGSMWNFKVIGEEISKLCCCKARQYLTRRLLRFSSYRYAKQGILLFECTYLKLRLLQSILYLSLWCTSWASCYCVLWYTLIDLSLVYIIGLTHANVWSQWGSFAAACSL